ncbi:type II toxin-antitoxin system RelE/ParE family toxin [Streptomyces sp. LP05-1]|uniref:Type II toxin-antitoxin system RelE/ParE family toxin n=1 Tax=Streptomyces pyxinae TaxID=2970734 RepID=A0ABT2CP79_9ACTN|nr:type II toxin-antitoxin system RelE/ParE family toxin [Streptomyces sp. LP05-1]MCS0639120.1 type II toxin-antitoxin system RelE/ParE family toxin [Streptomyces sp. LP05-1]
MRYQVIWEPEALSQAERFAKSDPHGVRQVFTRVDHLADDPRPRGAFGSANLLRIHIGLYRVVYEIDAGKVRVTVIHLGRKG